MTPCAASVNNPKLPPPLTEIGTDAPIPVMFKFKFPNPVFVIDVTLPAFVNGPFNVAVVNGLGMLIVTAFGTVTKPLSVAVYAVVVVFSKVGFP
jgi:hypothetical protein